jgi:cytochrome c biogenesis protein CcmG, thiol:disulfide interchange protein DsbE
MENQSIQRKLNKSQFIPLVLIGAGLIILGLLLIKVLTKPVSAVESSVMPSVVNFPAPELRLNDLNGKKVNIADYRQQIVMINNWATWCPPCKAEMPTLEKYYQAHSDQGFMLFGIEAGDSKKDVSSFVEDYGYTFPILIDPNTTALNAFHNDGLPSSYVIDHEGNVILAWTGPISREMLEKYVTPLLEQ